MMETSEAIPPSIATEAIEAACAETGALVSRLRAGEGMRGNNVEQGHAITRARFYAGAALVAAFPGVPGTVVARAVCSVGPAKFMFNCQQFMQSPRWDAAMAERVAAAVRRKRDEIGI